MSAKQLVCHFNSYQGFLCPRCLDLVSDRSVVFHFHNVTPPGILPLEAVQNVCACLASRFRLLLRTSCEQTFEFNSAKCEFVLPSDKPFEGYRDKSILLLGLSNEIN